MQTTQSEYFDGFPVLQKHQVNQTITKNPFQELTLPDSDCQFMETSFQENIAEDHATAIWNASVEFLKNSVNVDFDTSKGFNDQGIFDTEYGMKEERTDQIEVEELIAKNSILQNWQKDTFAAQLLHEKDLKSLVEKTSRIFCEEVFEEIIVIFCQAWERFMTFKQTTKLSEELSKFLAPTFSNFNLNLDQIVEPKQKTLYFLESEQEIIAKADEAGEEISGCYFISTKMKFINLKQAETSPNRRNFIRKQFEQFIKIITRGVFLCSSGCFHHPNGANFSMVSMLGQDAVGFSEKSIDLSDIQRGAGRKRRNT